MNLERFTAARPTYASVTLYTAVFFTLGAAAIHFVVAPPHLREYLPSGAFFLAVAGLQTICAIEMLARPTRRLALWLTAGSMALVALWFASRTVGLPLGATPGTPEDIGLTDVLCVIMETLAAVLFMAVAVRRPRRRMRRVWLRAIAAAPSAMLSMALSGVAVAAATSGMPASVSAAPHLSSDQTVSVAQLTEQPGPEPVDRFTLTAQVDQVDGQTARTFNGSIPGPELRVRQGDRVQVTLVNRLPESTTLHWHGLRLPNAMDGVAGMTQDAVPPGQSFTYEFVAREAGTYWYHSHQQTGQQLPRGLFGALIVEQGPPTQDRDYTVLLHGTPGHVRIGNTRLEALPGESVRLRIIDAVAPGMDGGPETPVLLGAPFRVAALDGRDLNEPTLLGATRVPLGMGQRADLVFTMPPAGQVELRLAELQGQTSFVQHVFERLSPPDAPSDVVTIGEGAAPEPTDLLATPMFDLLSYGAPDSQAAMPFDRTTSMVLDAQPGFRDGRPELVHTIDGFASPWAPPLQVTEGQRVLLHVVNNTDEYHPMHIHGHVFTVVSRNGESATGSAVRLDTLLVGPHESWDVAFVADNPGIWMIHCHVLLHAEMGMSMALNYTGVSTPFEMGTRTGNLPE